MEASATLTIPRMFSDAAGECRFDQTDIPLVMKVYAPGRAGRRERSHANWAVCLYAYPAGVCLIDANTEGLGHVSEVIYDVPFEAYLIALT